VTAGDIATLPGMGAAAAPALELIAAGLDVWFRRLSKRAWDEPGSPDTFSFYNTRRGDLLDLPREADKSDVTEIRIFVAVGSDGTVLPDDSFQVVNRRQVEIQLWPVRPGVSPDEVPIGDRWARVEVDVGGEALDRSAVKLGLAMLGAAVWARSNGGAGVQSETMSDYSYSLGRLDQTTAKEISPMAWSMLRSFLRRPVTVT
jgi:hypothetical protein